MGPDIHRNISNQTLKSFNGYATKTFCTRPESSRIKKIWRNSNAVCFDVDSTVCKDEAIDELAEYLGKGAEVAACTQRAMNGSMSFREALRLRLEVMQPTFSQVRNYADTHEIALTPGIIELVEKLQNRGTDVYLVSGGFRPLIIPVAQRLGIPINRIYANEILYHEDGSYAGFDINELTSDSGDKEIGKAGVCGLLKKLHGYSNIVMIGDGATDAEASPPADAFIGFGGNQVREAVRQQAGWYVYDFETLNSELDDNE
jgi:phosphoserine phosphatase